MKGFALILDPGQVPRVEALTGPPTLAYLQAKVGGYIEAIPGFVWVLYDGEERACVAFCNEEGKLKEGGLLNNQATRLWHQSLDPPGLIDPKTGHVVDALIGPVVVLFGDPAFMRRL